ncbi:MAG: menaquinone biosynthesis protein [Hydrogenobacter sp.]
MIRIGKVSYLNTMPLFYKWEDPKLELVSGHPSNLVRMLRKGSIHAGIVSSAEYLINMDLYTYVPNVSISSRERVCSVLFFSKVPIDKVKKVYLTPNSVTSRYLSVYILEEVYRLKPIYTEDRKEADCLLLIGDEALFEKKAGRYIYIYDLAEEWYRIHKLPFVFALFTVRKDAPSWLSERIEELCKISMEAFYKDLFDGKIEVDGFRYDELLTYFTKCLYNGLHEDGLRSLKIFMEFLSSRGYTLK